MPSSLIKYILYIKTVQQQLIYKFYFIFNIDFINI